MGLDDNTRDNVARNLESQLLGGDRAGLQNSLVKLHEQYPEDFGKILDSFKQMVDKDRSNIDNLPQVHINKEWFGFGGVEQVVIEDSAQAGGKKQEVFETQAHRAKETQDDRSAPLNLGAAIQNWMEKDKWVDTPDYQKDASLPTDTVSLGKSGDVPGRITVNQMEGDGSGRTVGALDASQNQTMTESDQNAILQWADKQRGWR